MLLRPVLALAIAGLLTACSAQPALDTGRRVRASEASPHPAERPPADDVSSAAPTGPRTSDGHPAAARLDIAALGIRGLRVVPYRGWTDDARGTAIQNDGLAASPHGPRGGVGPGGIGNYQVTAHRLSSTQAFEFLPRLRAGQRVVVETARWRYVYEIRQTRRTSFRSARSLAEQRAAVPGHPGRPPTRAMITLSTCATVEDHAAGNYWADEFDNPEHRIDKVGVLVGTHRSR
ncbi:MAG TPA: sortase [Nocardioides sp.]|nr:sortase [Nocardioides sp.]